MGDARRRNVSLLLDHQVDGGRADRVAVICGEERVTYGALLGRAACTAAALHDAGVRREERVLLLLDDTPAFPATFLGAIRLGAVPVPVNPLYKPSDFRYFLEDSYARVVVADPAFVEKAAQAIEGLDGVRVYEPPDLLDAGGGAGRRSHPGGGHPRGRHGLLALQLGVHRAAEGGRPPPGRRRRHLRDLRRLGAGPDRRRRHLLHHEAVPRLRPGQRPVVSLLDRRHDRAHTGAAEPGRHLLHRRDPPAERLLLRPHALQRPRERRRGQGAGLLLRPHLRVGRRAAAPGRLPPLRGNVGPADPRRHRLDRDAPHLLLQHRRGPPAGVERPARPGLRAADPRRRRPAGRPRRGGRAAGEGRQRPVGVLAPPGPHPAHPRRGVLRHRRPLPDRRRRLLLVRGPGRRHDQGRRPVGVAHRDRERAHGALGGARGRGRRRRGRRVHEDPGPPHPPAGVDARPAGGRAGDRTPEPLQGAPPALPVPPHRPLREGPPEDHDRQDPALRPPGRE